MKITAVSDTHMQHEAISISETDLLIHCGDALLSGTRKEYELFVSWLGAQPADCHVYVPGNHDKAVQENMSEARRIAKRSGVKLLIDTSLKFQGKTIYGMPWAPRFGLWAFMLDRNSEALQTKIQAIPPTTDILVTHGPPYGHNDLCPLRPGQIAPLHAGCRLLLDKVLNIQPQIHLFGHIHSGAGASGSQEAQTVFINAAQVDESHRIVQLPVSFTLK